MEKEIARDMAIEIEMEVKMEMEMEIEIGSRWIFIGIGDRIGCRLGGGLR